ncbi:Isonitrile hydratase [Paramyrothecium foliicola]|nr:Isonitrile hydratase [Paramyrothecium foliicola]
MRFSTLFSSVSALALLPFISGSTTPTRQASCGTDGGCIAPRPIPDVQGSDLRNYGFVLFQALDVIDVFGPLDVFQLMAHSVQQMNLHLIAATLDPVSTAPVAMNRFNSSFWPVLTPTSTFDDDVDLDVLVVPGGPGARNPNLDPLLGYLRKMFPRVKVFMTICTGAGLAARAGLLNDTLATTNKNAWATMTAWGPDVNWVSPARYTIDGKVWTSSGVTSSLDLSFAFLEAYWGAAHKERIAAIIEHVPRDRDDDPFSSHFNITETPAQPCKEQQSDA